MIAKIRMEVLGKKGCQRIHEDGLTVLEKTGIRVDDTDLRQILVRKGAKADTGDKVIFPREMVKEALKNTDRKPVLNSPGGKELHIYGKNQYCGALTNDPWIVDYEKGPRKPVLADIENHARLADALPLVDGATRMDYPCEDVPDEIANLKTLQALVSNTTKALSCAPSSLESAAMWVDIAEIMAGGSLHKKPSLSAYVATVSPLIMSLEDGRMFRYLAEKGVLMRGGGCPLSGATSPFSLAGTMVVAEAEMLFTITALQCLRPGAACLYSVGGYVMEMTSGIYSTASVEGQLMGIAYAEMSRFHDLPTLAGICTSDVPHYDFQNGVESALHSFISFFGGRNFLYGLGSLANATGMSAEQMVLHHDLVEVFRRISEGMDMSRQTEVVESVMKAGPGGNFLMDDITIALLRSGEHFYGRSFVRAMPGPVDTTMVDKAHERVTELLSSHKPAVNQERIKQVNQYVEDKIKEVRANRGGSYNGERE